MEETIKYKDFEIEYDGLLSKIGTFQWGGFKVFDKKNNKEIYIRIKITDTLLNALWKATEKIDNTIKKLGLLKVKIHLCNNAILSKGIDYTIDSSEAERKSYKDYVLYLEKTLEELEEKNNKIGFQR